MVTAETHYQSASRKVFIFELGTCDSILYITIVPTNITKPEAMNKVMVLLSKVEPQNAIIPIIFNGKESETKNFINRYDLAVTSNQKVIYFPNINGSVVTANITKSDLQRIIGNLSVFEVLPSSKSVVGSISIQPNQYIINDEDDGVSLLLDKIQKGRVMEIIRDSDGVNSAECRNET